MNEPIGLFPLSRVAEAIGIPPRRLRHLADSGKIQVLQFTEGGKRYVPQGEVERLSREGFPVAWSDLIE